LLYNSHGSYANTKQKNVAVIEFHDYIMDRMAYYGMLSVMADTDVEL